jgi:hypothetical protein
MTNKSTHWERLKNIGGKVASGLLDSGRDLMESDLFMG